MKGKKVPGTILAVLLVFAFAECSNPSGGGEDNVPPVVVPPAATGTGDPDTAW